MNIQIVNNYSDFLKVGLIPFLDQALQPWSLAQLHIEMVGV
jgi:hypothetical protein